MSSNSAMPHATVAHTVPAAVPLSALRALLRRQALAFAVFSAAITTLLLVPTIYMLQVYDRVLASRNESTLLMLTLLVLGLYAVLSALEAVRSAICARLAVQTDRLLAPAVFQAALQHTGTGVRSQLLLTDLTTVRQAVAGPLPALVFDLPLAAVFVAAAFVVDRVLGGFVAGAIVLLMGLALWQERTMRPLQQQASRESAQAADALHEAARQGELVRSLGMQGALQQRWLAIHGGAARLLLNASADAGRIGAVLRLARLSTQSLALGVGAWLVLEQRITPGMVIAASVLLGRALTPVEGLIGQSRTLATLRDSWQRLNEALYTKPLPAPIALPEAVGALKAENLALTVTIGTNTQDGSAVLLPLLQDIQITLNAGQVLAVVGGSGAGKSTLARVLCGALPPSSGHVRLDGAELSQWPDEQRSRAIGVLPQDVHLFNGTVAENIARMAADVDSTVVLQAAQAAGVHEMILRLPQGYQTVVGAAGLPLSGGQRQRIGLARALYGSPALLVLDEPNSHLDEAGDQALRQALLAHKEAGGSAVVVSHRMALLQVADQVMVLHAGRVQRQGPRDEVMRAIQQMQPATAAPKQPATAGLRPMCA